MSLEDSRFGQEESNEHEMWTWFKRGREYMKESRLCSKTLIKPSSDKSVIKGGVVDSLGFWEEIFSIYHQLYGRGSLLKMTDGRRVETCRTGESGWLKADGWQKCVLPSRFHVCPSAAGSYSSLSANERERETEIDGVTRVRERESENKPRDKYTETREIKTIHLLMARFHSISVFIVLLQ